MMEHVYCPHCESDAIYNYGRTKNGKQRYLCLLCNRQFINDRRPKEFEKRPKCPICGGKTHIYRREKEKIRFRCSKYPLCRGYVTRNLDALPA